MLVTSRCPTPSAEAAAGEGAGVVAVVDDDLAVDDHIDDADGVVPGVTVPSVGLDRIGVEHDDVGPGAVPQYAPVGQSELSPS